MIWEKQGRFFETTEARDWNKSHAQCPVVDTISDQVWRIYYASRNAQGQSQISYIETEAENPKNIIYAHPNFLFEFGQLGTFDDSGLMPSCIVNVGCKKYLYYIGWTPRTTVPYQNSIGLAVSEDGGKSFRRLHEGSVFPPTTIEPYFTGTSHVMIEDGLWRCWYLSCTGWEVVENRPEPSYHIKYAESEDGVNWTRTGRVAVDYTDKLEGGIVSATVLKINCIYHMWYAYRGKRDYRHNLKHSYRIGYAISEDGICWQRNDANAGIDVSSTGWDSEMISYPNVVASKDKLYMFYNGNGFGRSGIGYATTDR